ncbi:hypothetical protein CDAR_53941 [Caerostris darwini]|uniref:Uncharacterized protein n=1 Tax=Caerostris darwini TaxID=1538125 RepID=A0AAV4WCU7_9ARAC|nr:hypothetical protein CDAR_53941 [Caerostris darwini]
MFSLSPLNIRPHPSHIKIVASTSAQSATQPSSSHTPEKDRLQLLHLEIVCGRCCGRVLPVFSELLRTDDKSAARFGKTEKIKVLQLDARVRRFFKTK